MISLKLSLVLVLTLIGSLCLGAENGTKIRENLKNYNQCLLDSVYSFISPTSYVPTSTEALRNSCKVQSEGFKCVKDRSKGSPAILRRGLLAFIQGRQRYHKKYCTNVNSASSKRIVQDFKCIMDKKLPAYEKIDRDFLNTMLELDRRNYADSAMELKYLCCSIYNYRKTIIDQTGPECDTSKATIEEMIMNIVPNDINLICEDEDKLLGKVCSKLEPINAPKALGKAQTQSVPIGTVLYLIATLGEPES